MRGQLRTPQLPGNPGKPGNLGIPGKTENSRAQGEERLREADLIMDHRVD